MKEDIRVFPSDRVFCNFSNLIAARICSIYFTRFLIILSRDLSLIGITRTFSSITVVGSPKLNSLFLPYRRILFLPYRRILFVPYRRVFASALSQDFVPVLSHGFVPASSQDFIPALSKGFFLTYRRILYLPYRIHCSQLDRLHL